jgi:micrococcal nuclease
VFRRFLILTALLAMAPSPALSAKATDHEAASFGLCSGPGRVTCVVDGDTFWYRGQKIRIADINAPETSHPACAREAALGKAAAERLVVLLNEGLFTLDPYPRDHDRYGRLLRTVTRSGASVGGALVREGLAEAW